MYNCCAKNCFDCANCNLCECPPRTYNSCFEPPNCNICECPPKACECRRASSAEFPKQRGCYVEEKFSNIIPPSFLCNTRPPLPSGRPRSCNCKNGKTSKYCQCKAKGISDCAKKRGKDSGERECETTCENNGSGKTNNGSTGRTGSTGRNGSKINKESRNKQNTPNRGISDEETEKEAASNGAISNRVSPIEVSSNDGRLQRMFNTGTPNGVLPNGEMIEYGCTPVSWQGPDGTAITIEDNPGYSDFRYSINQQYRSITSVVSASRRLCNVPAAGLPTGLVPPFDPCTGQECISAQPGLSAGLEHPEQPEQPGQFDLPAITEQFGQPEPILPIPPGPCMTPCFCPNAQYYPNPEAMFPPLVPQELPEENQDQNKDNGTNKDKGKDKGKEKDKNNDKDKTNKPNTRSKVKDKPERMERNRLKNYSQPSESRRDPSKEKDRVTFQPPKSKSKGNNETQLINCAQASPELIERICASLQVPRPPESCYILVPINMTPRKSDPAPNVQALPKPDNKQKNIEKPKSNGDIEPEPIPEQKKKEDEFQCRPTRNCGCNTSICGNYGSGAQTPVEQQQQQQQPDQSNTSPNNNVCGRCYWPCYSYCYNPYTGYYYWCKNRCCYSGCGSGGASCGGCSGGSCPLPQAKSAKSSPESTKRDEPPKSPKKAKSSSISGDDKRFEAGAVPSVQPEQKVDPSNCWMGYQQFVNNNVIPIPAMPPVPPIPAYGQCYYQSVRFFPM